MYQYGPLLSFARKKIAYRWIDWCLRYLLLVMCAHPFAKEALTLHLARSEGHERYLGCNLMHHKVLASSQQHLMAEAPRGGHQHLIAEAPRLTPPSVPTYMRHFAP